MRDALCDELYEFLDVPEDQRSLEQLFRRLTDQDPAVLAVAFARLEAFAGWISRLAEARRVAPRTGPAAGTAKQAMPVETAIGMGTRPARGSHRPTLS